MENADRGPILVLDDDEAVRAVVRDVLEEAGYLVLTAATANAARDIIERERVALVLLDQLGPRDAAETERMFARCDGHRPAIVIFSAVTDPSRIAAKMRADDWLRKPFEIDELLEIVQRHAATDGSHA